MNNEKNNMTSQIDKETGAGEMMGSEAVIKQGNVMGAGKIVNTKEIAISAVFIALTYVFTAFINIRLPFIPNGGLIHLGNIPLFIAAMVFGWKVGMLAGGVGMALFDLTTPWAIWAPFTFVIAGLMGFSMGKITSKKDNVVTYIFAVLVAAVIKIVGYYFAEVILYGNWITPFTSVVGNLCQIAVAGIIVVPIVGTIKKAVKSR